MAKSAGGSQAEALKAQGNQLFLKNKLGAAIDAYTEAITLCPTVSTYYTNRALCYKKREDWDAVQADCQTALQLDKDSVKGHYMLGLVLLQRKIYEEAVREMGKALQLAHEGKGGTGLVEEIWGGWARAKYVQWEAGAEGRRERSSGLRVYLQAIMKADLQRHCTQTTYHNSCVDEEGEGEVTMNGGGEEWTLRKDLENKYEERVNTLENLFDKAERNDRPTEVPEHLCCNITMDIFRDPVITPSGISYERAVLMEHFRRGRKFDPVSRAPMEPDQVVPNLALREAVQAYLEEHGWAYNHAS